MMEDVHEYYQQMTLLKRPKHLTRYLLNPEEVSHIFELLTGKSGNNLGIGRLEEGSLPEDRLKHRESIGDGFRPHH